ncbi:phosphate ABC transporter ATP-binding protein, partial [Bacillus pseudomycoides]
MVATVVNVQVKNEEKIESATKKVVFDTKNL